MLLSSVGVSCCSGEVGLAECVFADGGAALTPSGVTIRSII